MDKCILSNNDIDELFKWRDSHINLIYRDSVPIKAIEIILPDIIRGQNIFARIIQLIYTSFLMRMKDIIIN
jgi:hypothetical protein